MRPPEPHPTRRPQPTRLLLLLLAASFGLAATGCEPYPRDPRNTLDEIQRDDVLWVGVSPSPPWTRVDDERLSGVEVELAAGLADAMDVEVRWLVMSESEVVDALKHGEVDLGIGGFTRTTPWKKHVGLTNPYVTVDTLPHVMAVPAGENRWLMRVEDYLRGRGEGIRRALEATSVEPRELKTVELSQGVLR